MKERKLGNFLVGSLKMISFRLSRERNRKIGLNIEKNVVNVKSNKHFWKAVRTKATRSKLTRIGRVWLVEEKVSTLDHIYIYIYRVVQSLRNLEIEVVAVSNTRTFLPAKRNLEETCPILSIFRGELWAITTPSSPLLISLSLSHTVCLQRLSGTRSWQRYFQQRLFRSALARASDARSAAISIACPSRAISRGARVVRHAIERNLDASAAKVIEEGEGRGVAGCGDGLSTFTTFPPV